MMFPYEGGVLVVFKARRRAHGWGYVTEAATLKTGKQTSEMAILFASKFPRWGSYFGSMPKLVLAKGSPNVAE